MITVGHEGSVNVKLVRTAVMRMLLRHFCLDKSNNFFSEAHLIVK
jgi:hypothetical protein